jgi:hypothetical protein
MFYREVRRLAYLSLICDIVYHESGNKFEIITQLILDRIKQEKLNNQLNMYYRKTGNINELSVSRNHLLVAKKLKLVDIEENYIIKNAATILFSTLKDEREKDKKNNFFNLTNYEKVAFLYKLLEVKDFDIRFFLENLDSQWQSIDSIKGKMKEKKMNLKDSTIDHAVKSNLDWLVDLGIVLFTLPSGGKVCLSAIGKEMKFDTEKEILLSYCEQLGMKKEDIIRDKLIINSFQLAINKMDNRIKSTINEQLLNAAPIILFLQIDLLFKGFFYKKDELINKLYEVLPKYSISFSWDPSVNEGYFKINRK